MEGGGGWKGEVNGRRRWMEGGGGWQGGVDGRRISFVAELLRNRLEFSNAINLDGNR